MAIEGYALKSRGGHSVTGVPMEWAFFLWVVETSQSEFRPKAFILLRDPQETGAIMIHKMISIKHSFHAL